jgi:chromosome segregation ATPase
MGGETDIESKRRELNEKETELKEKRDDIASIVYEKPDIVKLVQRLTKIKNMKPPNFKVVETNERIKTEKILKINSLTEQRNRLVERYMSEELEKSGEYKILSEAVTKLKNQLDSLEQKMDSLEREGQQYPPGTQKKELEFSRSVGGGKGEPGVPPREGGRSKLKKSRRRNKKRRNTRKTFSFL